MKWGYKYWVITGFVHKRYAQGLQYTDGHERKDVLEFCKKYLNMIKALECIHKPPTICKDGIPSWNSGKATVSRQVISFTTRQFSRQTMHYQKAGMMIKVAVNRGQMQRKRDHVQRFSWRIQQVFSSNRWRVWAGHANQSTARKQHIAHKEHLMGGQLAFNNVHTAKITLHRPILHLKDSIVAHFGYLQYRLC